jgi:hemerythrin
MPDFLVWQDAWLMGIDHLDADHRELVRLLNTLFERSQDMVDDADSVSVLTGMKRLIAHMRRHFDAEERFLQEIEYPLFEAHKREHSIEMAEFVDICRALENSGEAALDLAALQNIKTWFFNHVIAEDHKFAEYYFGEYRPRLVGHGKR